MDGAHTHGHGPSGLGELVVLGFGVVLAADILARVLTLLLIVLAVAGGLLLIGFIAYVVTACRRYQQATALDTAQLHWPVVPEDLPRSVNADPVTLRQAITELQARLLIARGGLPAADTSQHQHLHFHGLTPEQAAAIIADLHARQPPAGWKDGGSQ
jgi:predicted membrane channel-forming protein YqfA (hemolysin III family)